MKIQNKQIVCVNVGCGSSPTAGYINFDNSLAVRFKKFSNLMSILANFSMISRESVNLALLAKKLNINYCDATNRIPMPDNSVDVLYSCHMIEHLDTKEIKSFLKEALRVLKKGGVLRTVFPDLSKLVATYQINGDATEFMTKTGLCRDVTSNPLAKVKLFLSGDRGHKILYDSASFSKTLNAAGFKTVFQLDYGQTTIVDCGKLDLSERAFDGQDLHSAYVEAVA